MKLAFAAIALIATTPVLAQTKAAPRATPTATASPSAVAPAATAPSAGATKFSLETPIETIAADPAGKAVLDADFPGMTAHPMYESFKTMSLAAVQPMSGGAITDAQIAKAKTDLEAIK